MKDVLKVEQESDEDLALADGPAAGEDDGSRLAFSWRRADRRYGASRGRISRPPARGYRGACPLIQLTRANRRFRAPCVCWLEFPWRAHLPVSLARNRVRSETRLPDVATSGLVRGAAYPPEPPCPCSPLPVGRGEQGLHQAEAGSRAQGVAGAARSPQGEDTGHPRRAQRPLTRPERLTLRQGQEGSRRRPSCLPN